MKTILFLFIMVCILGSTDILAQQEVTGLYNKRGLAGVLRTVEGNSKLAEGVEALS